MKLINQGDNVMAKSKNFKINRRCGPRKVRAVNLEIGQMFERQGSIHMMVNHCHSPKKQYMVTICNLNTGSVWDVPDDEMYEIVSECEITYNVEV